MRKSRGGFIDPPCFIFNGNNFILFHIIAFRLQGQNTEPVPTKHTKKCYYKVL